MIEPSCENCAHVDPSGLACAAFLGGIPLAILAGEHDHRKPYPGDNGIRFVMRNNSEAKKTADNLQESLAAD